MVNKNDIEVLTMYNAVEDKFRLLFRYRLWEMEVFVAGEAYRNIKNIDMVVDYYKEKLIRDKQIEKWEEKERNDPNFKRESEG